MIIPVSSVVTKKTITEFDLLKLSLEEFHDAINLFLEKGVIEEEPK